MTTTSGRVSKHTRIPIVRTVFHLALIAVGIGALSEGNLIVTHRSTSSWCA